MSRTTSPRMAKLLAAGSIVVAGLMAAAGAQAHGGVSLSVGISVPGVAGLYAATPCLLCASGTGLLCAAAARVSSRTRDGRARPGLLRWRPALAWSSPSSSLSLMASMTEP